MSFDSTSIRSFNSKCLFDAYVSCINEYIGFVIGVLAPIVERGRIGRVCANFAVLDDILLRNGNKRLYIAHLLISGVENPSNDLTYHDSIEVYRLVGNTQEEINMLYEDAEKAEKANYKLRCCYKDADMAVGMDVEMD